MGGIFWRLTSLLCGLALVVAVSPLKANPAAIAPGTRTVSLVAADGTRLEIGTLEITEAEVGRNFEVKLAAPAFKEEFLSMRPFICLPDARQMWCHLAYPFETKGRITVADLVDLEYALLFLWKAPDKVSIDAWNGLYFKLAAAADGSISGDLHEADFNVLAVPPDDPMARPIAHTDLTRAEPAQHRFPRIEIR